MATAMSLAMAAATDASLLLHPAHHKLAPASASLPLLFSRAPPLRSARPRLPLTPLVASSDAAEADLDWADADETVPEEGVAEEEPAAAGDESYAADSPPPEEAKIYVGNLPYDVDSERLAQLFDQAGVVEVAECLEKSERLAQLFDQAGGVEVAEVIYNRESGQSRGFGFVTMSTIEEADKAIETFNRYDISGRLLNVNRAAQRGSRVERPPRQFASAFRAYVGNLPWQAEESGLVQLFSQHGEVLNATVVYDRETGRSRGFGFVTMTSKEDLDSAISALDGEEMDGRPLRVNVAAERPQRGF